MKSQDEISYLFWCKGKKANLMFKIQYCPLVTLAGIRLAGHFQPGEDIAEIIVNEVAYFGCVKFLSPGF